MSTSSNLSHFKFSVGDTFESLRTIRVPAKDGRSGQDIQLQYSHQKVIGNGSFGVVYQVKTLHNGESAAVKKVLQDKRFKNRELEIMRMMNHPNICGLKAYFYTQGDSKQKDEIYLNLVMEYVPETVYRVSRHYTKIKQTVPMLIVKLYMYQLFRSLAYSHAFSICHRDIKPQNLLVHPITGVLKLCDFGSAKVLVSGEQNVAYICSRYYRAPELIFGASCYTTSIDIWSSACVMATLSRESGIDQLVEIIKVLGTPSKEQILTMNPSYTEHKFQPLNPIHYPRYLDLEHHPRPLIYCHIYSNIDPKTRPTASEAMVHPFFDELRNPETKMATGRELPELFDFSKEELSIRPDLLHKLVPPHCHEKLLRSGIDVNNFNPIPLELTPMD